MAGKLTPAIGGETFDGTQTEPRPGRDPRPSAQQLVTATATPDQTLPDASDERDVEQLSLFGRAGQLALPGAVAQLGLDGAAYAPDPIGPPATAGDRQSLATNAMFCAPGVLPPTEGNAPGPLPGQLPLLGEWFESAQTSMWGRLGNRNDVTRPARSCPPDCECHPHARLSKCLKVRHSLDAAIDWKRSEYGHWSPTGLVTCGSVLTCPYCGPRRCRDLAGQLAITIDEFLAARGDDDARPWRDVWMLTLKVPHYLDENQTTVVDHLYDSAETLFRSSPFRKWCERWGIVGRVRVLDVTFGGPNGIHPHFHCAIFVEKAGITPAHAWSLEEHNKRSNEWVVDARGDVDCNGVAVQRRGFAQLDDEIARWGYYKPLRVCSKHVRLKYLAEVKGSLIAAWEKAVRASGARIESDANFRANSLDLTPGENAASYYTKWGLENEVGNPSAKDKGVLRLLDACVAGVKGATWTYKQWLHASKGRALCVGITDIMRRVFPLLDGETKDQWSERIDTKVREHQDEQRRRREAELAREGTPVVKVPELRVQVRSHLYAAAMAVGWEQMLSFVDDQALVGRGDSPDWLQRALDDFLWRNLPVARGSPDG